MKKIFFLIDMNAFYISCEERQDITLRQKNAAVGGDPKKRTGVILTSNYNARKFGVRAGMSVYEARIKCPDLVLVKPDHALYSAVSMSIMNVLSEYTPAIEQNSIDEAWLDMTNADKYYKMSYMSIAKKIQKDIYEKEEIPCSIGISFTKFLSKMAAGIKKPNGIIMLDDSNFKEIIWPLDISKMYGCGEATSKKLKSLDIQTIGDLAKADMYVLKKHIGALALSMHQNANGMGIDTLDTVIKNKSISRETTFSEDTQNIDDILKEAIPLIEDVSKQIRDKHYCYSTVYIIIKYNDFTRITRQTKVKTSNDRDTIYKNVKMLLHNNKLKKPIRLFGLGVSDVSDECVFQLDILSKGHFIDDIYKVIDEKNKKYGKDIIKRGHR